MARSIKLMIVNYFISKLKANYFTQNEQNCFIVYDSLFTWRSITMREISGSPLTKNSEIEIIALTAECAFSGKTITI